jgi:hypothetical protein
VRRRIPASLNLIARPHVEPTPPNPYAPPSSAVGDSEFKGAITPNAKLYTPAQIRAGSFLGGPIAAAYLLWKNFRVLDRGPEARTTVVWGVAFVAGLMVLLPFLPARFPNYLIPLLYSIAAGSVADKWQLQKQAIVDSGRFQIQSNWRVFGMALLFMIAFMLIIVFEMFCLDALGLMHL